MRQSRLRKAALPLVAGALLLACLLLAACGSDEQQSDVTTPVADPPAQSASPTPDASCGAEVTFVELGSDSCIPCKEMRPIMKIVAEKYEGIVEVVFHDVYEDRDAAEQYGVRVIPTQVFLDQSGQEFYRHEGFLSLLAIEGLLAKRGIQPTAGGE